MLGVQAHLDEDVGLFGRVAAEQLATHTARSDWRHGGADVDWDGGRGLLWSLMA